MKNLIIITIIIAAIAVGVMLYTKNRALPDPVVNPDDDNDNKPAPNPKTCCEFPLKKGAKCKFVKELQNALIEKFGKPILPKFGADGIYGNELTSALNRIGIDNILIQSGITEKLYNIILTKLKESGGLRA
jgi:hypothetical protein